MAINLHKSNFLERGSVITLPCKYILVRADYESPAAGQEINLDLSAFLLNCDGKIPTEDHFIYYNNPQSPDGSIQCFDDLEIQGDTGEMTLGVDLAKVNLNVAQIVIILTIHEAKRKNQNISHLNRPYIRFCDYTRELYRFELVGGESARSLEFCRILRNGSAWVVVATGIESPKELGDHAMSYISTRDETDSEQQIDPMV
jgi:tellurium resistance protein TerD